ncbi:MAG: hypothetical protein E7523_11240 [Ruminococcaceae bacterium]|nr:hypothetical protein [Oscillospiraceae bacterium]
MKKHFFRLLVTCLIAVFVFGFSACKDKQEEIPAAPSVVMDTTISQQAYLSELVDPVNPTEAVTQTPQGEKPSPSTPGKPVNGMFFDDAVFVGDSVSLKLNYYVSDQRSYGDCLGKAKFLTSGSLGSAQALLAVSSESLHPTYQGEKLRLEDTISNIGAQKVFIMLGMNDIAVYGIEGSLDNYEELVEDILAKSPGAVIYAQSCTPMAIGCERSVLNNKNIVKYNNALKERCAENGWRYMDIYSVVVDADGFLKADFCSDPDDMGIHFTDAGCKAWVDYLMDNAG